jgi:thiol-disulfide isomerase/thioredoxin
MKITTDNKNRSWLTVSNGITGLLVLLIILMIVFPGVKAGFIMGLMKMGLFRPSIPSLVQTDKESPRPAPDILFYNENDTVISLSSLKGKIVFINFWAPWCPPCLAEMPGINNLYQKIDSSNHIVFIMVDADADLSKSKLYMSGHQYNLPLYKTGVPLPASIFDGSLPTTLVIDKKGYIVFRETGAANYDIKKFNDFLKQLAAQ